MGKHKKKCQDDRKQTPKHVKSSNVQASPGHQPKSSNVQTGPGHRPKSSDVQAGPSHRSKSGKVQARPRHRTNSSKVQAGPSRRPKSSKTDVEGCQSVSPKGHKRDKTPSTSSKRISSKRKRKASVDEAWSLWSGSPSQSQRKVMKLNQDIMISVPTPNHHRTTKIRDVKHASSNSYSHLTPAEKELVINFKVSVPKKLPKDSNSTRQPSPPGPNEAAAKSSHVPSKSTAKEAECSANSRIMSKCTSKPSASSSQGQKTPKTVHSSHSKTLCDSVIIVNESPASDLSSRKSSFNLITSTPFPSSRREKGVFFSSLTPIIPSSFSFSCQKSTSAQDISKALDPVFSISGSQKSMSALAPGKATDPVFNMIPKCHNDNDGGLVGSFTSNAPCAIGKDKGLNLSDEPESGIVITSPPNDCTQTWSHDSICTPKGSSLHSSFDPSLTLINEGSSGNNTVIIIDSATTICPSPEHVSFEVIEILDSDTEDMEVDDDEMMESLLTVREQTTNLDGKVAGSLSETILNATVNEVSPPVKVKQIVLAIDTNILIHSSAFFTNLFNIEVPGQGRPIILLPWMVILELDQLKVDRPWRSNSDPAVAFRARQATRLLQKLVTERHPQLVCQKATEVSEDLGMPIHSNDDRILHCCLQWKKRHENDRVMLVTRDRNLSTKALILDIETSTNTDLWAQLNRQTSHPVVDRTEGPAALQQNKNDAVSLQKALPKDTGTNLNRHTFEPKAGKTVRQNNKNNDVNAYKDHVMGPQSDAQHVDNRYADVFNKISSIWDLILYSRSDLRSVMNAGHAHPRFKEGRLYLNSLTDQVITLKRGFDDCIGLSPVMLSSPMAEGLFSRLQFLLNRFFYNTGTALTDQTGNVTRKQLIFYFTAVENRLKLSQGLVELDEIIASLKNM